MFKIFLHFSESVLLLPETNKKKLKKVCAECIDIWDWNLGDEDSKSAKSGENGTDDGEMDVWGVTEG